jgi:hypothetical protein
MQDRSYAVFTDVSSTVITEFSDDTVVLLIELWLPCLILERIEWHLCGCQQSVTSSQPVSVSYLSGKSVVGSKCPPAALAVAERGPSIICRTQMDRILQGTAYAASFEIETHGASFGGLQAGRGAS